MHHFDRTQCKQKGPPAGSPRGEAGEAGNIILISLIIILLLIVAGVAYFLISKGNIKNPLQKQPKPQLKTIYKNPFKEESHYLNPFDEYKNPFDVIRATEGDE